MGLFCLKWNKLLRLNNWFFLFASGFYIKINMGEIVLKIKMDAWRTFQLIIVSLELFYISSYLLN